MSLPRIKENTSGNIWSCSYKYRSLCHLNHPNLNLNGLLVTRQIDNTSPGGVPEGKSVPGSRKRCELGHTVQMHATVQSNRRPMFFLFVFFIQFYVPFKLFHSYRDESIGRWGENRSTRGKNWTDFRTYMNEKKDKILKNLHQECVEVIWSAFKNALQSGISKYIPVKKFGTKRSLPWITQEIKRLVRKRDSLYQ